jgi:predicted metal-dependent hydrolase
MPADQELIVGQTRIPYQVVGSANARRSRIVVDGSGIRVIVPAGADAIERAAQFVSAKRRWLYRASRSLSLAPQPEERFLTGARVLFRGRRLKLTVAPSAADHITVACRSRFDVTLPRTVWAGEQREAEARIAVKQWLQQRLREDGQELASRFATQLGVDVRSVRVLPMKKLWASCGRDKVIRLHPDLVRLPGRVFEYVMAHEVAHLVLRNHSPQFWRVVRRLVPDYVACRAALDEADRESKR